MLKEAGQLEHGEKEKSYSAVTIEKPIFITSQDAVEFWEGKINGEKTFIAAIADGNGLIGTDAAKLAVKEAVKTTQETGEKDQAFFVRLFSLLHEKIRRIGKEKVKELSPNFKAEKDEADDFGTGGTTLSVIFLQKNILTIAYVGDSEIRIVEKSGHLKTLTRPHSVKNPIEARRLIDIGANLDRNAILSDKPVPAWTASMKRSTTGSGPTRILGAAEFGDLLSQTPTVSKTEILPDTHFVIMATDGLWKKIVREGKRKRVEKLLAEAKTPDEAKEKIVSLLKLWKLDDDVTILFIKKND